MSSASSGLFRRDINGLRAVAVLGVLLFHLFAYLKYQGILPQGDYFTGGYVGVDIFFVISGFLMTSIIVKRLESGSFSVWEFWKRRAGRICPALLAVVILVMAWGYFTQLPYNYKETSREALRALLFVSNFWFARDEGYFTESVLDKPLLHSWSLSVEWQFYLLYPLFLMLWVRFVSVKTLLHFVGILWGISFASSFVLADYSSSYFMLHVRAWELLSGGIVFLLPQLKLKAFTARALELGALLVIILNIVLAKPMDGWSTLSVLPGVLACAFMLWLNIERSCVSNVFFQFCGKISYSMYLIHWPVIVVSAKLELIDNFIVILLIIFAYSALSYYFIETKRKWHWKIIVIYAVLIGFSQYESGNKGYTLFNKSFPPYRYHQIFYGGGYIPNEGQISHGTLPGRPELILAGDSFARQYGLFFNQHLPYVSVFCDGQLYLKYFQAAGGEEWVQHAEDYYANFMLMLQNEDCKKVMLAHNWYAHLNKEKYTSAPNMSVDERLELVKKSLIDLAKEFPDKQFYIIGQTVSFNHIMPDCSLLKSHPHPLINSLFSWLDCAQTQRGDFTAVDYVNQQLAEVCVGGNLIFIDPNPAICHGQQCDVVKGEMLTFSDGSHLSLNGAETIGMYILQQIFPDCPDLTADTK